MATEDKRKPDLTEPEKTMRRVFRMQLARAYTHGRPVGDKEIEEIFGLLGDEAAAAERVLFDCVQLARDMARQSVYNGLHKAPGVDHEMVDQTAVYLETEGNKPK